MHWLHRCRKKAHPSTPSFAIPTQQCQCQLRLTSSFGYPNKASFTCAENVIIVKVLGEIASRRSKSCGCSSRCTLSPLVKSLGGVAIGTVAPVTAWPFGRLGNSTYCRRFLLRLRHEFPSFSISPSFHNSATCTAGLLERSACKVGLIWKRFHHMTKALQKRDENSKKSFRLSGISFVTFENHRNPLIIISKTSVVFNFLYLWLSKPEAFFFTFFQNTFPNLE